MPSAKLIKKTAGTIKTVLSGIPHECIEKAANSKFVKPFDINIVRVPIITDDENINKFVKEFDLTRPDKFVHFMVEAHYAKYESIMDSINDIKKNNLIDSISFIETGKDLIHLAIDNPQISEESLKKAQNMILQGTNQ